MGQRSITLSDTQKRVVSNALQESLAREFEDLDQCVITCRCPHCGSGHIAPKGQAGGKQRYICKDCERTFGEHTGNIFVTTRLPRKTWFQYAECIVNGLTLRESAKQTGVCLKTSCAMRKKICACAFKYYGYTGGKARNASGRRSVDDTAAYRSYSGEVVEERGA